MNYRQLDHVAVVATDAKLTRDWYCDNLDMKWIHRGEWDNNPYFVEKGVARLAIFQAGSPGERQTVVPRIDHFAFLAESLEDYAGIKHELEKKGVDYKEQDHKISMSIYLEDPNGITVEFTTYSVA